MKILQINISNKGSTGHIAENIKKTCLNFGVECRNAYGYVKNKKDRFNVDYIVSSWIDNHMHNRLARITGLEGWFSIVHTYIFMKKIKRYNPDIIHLHVIHNNYINFHQLFKYIKKYNIKIVWTLHDCWSFTGICPYFDMYNCEKWKVHCEKCPNFKNDPVNIIDSSKLMYGLKKKLFNQPENMTLVTPSEWLADLTRQSFLKKYNVKVINNGIDLDVFKPVVNNFREKYGIGEGKIILLGISFVWGKRKGLDVFVELASRLDDKFKIVLVGTNDTIDRMLPPNIISIHRTDNQYQLAEIYSAADIFVNPTREENFPTVNIESLACGTPIVGFKTGGSPEIPGVDCGIFVKKNDIDALEQAIYDIVKSNKEYKDICRKRALEFDCNLKFKEYVDLYEDIAHST